MRFLSRAAAALLIGVSACAFVAPAFAQTCVCPPAGAAVSGPIIEAPEPPPPLPVYEQPPMPAPGYHWTPGYWAWNNTDYYWVPGVWVEPPRIGVLWTPPYWGFVGGVFLFHAGYWAPHVGFYGGVDYGFGYTGGGYEGGRWENGQFFYNRAVNNLGGVRVGNTYNAPVTINRTNITYVSYNGGQGGIQLKPTPEQEQVAAEPHIAATPAQVTHLRTASVNPDQFHYANQGKPPVAATARPGELKGPGALPAKAPGTAEATPAGQNLAPKGEVRPAPIQRPATVPPMNAEKPIKPEEFNTQKAQEKPPAGEKMEKPAAGEKMERPAAVEKPMERPAAAGKPMEKPGVRPADLERPDKQGLGPRGMERAKEKPKEEDRPEKPQGLLKPPGERPITPAMSVGQPRPGMAQNGDPKPAAERKPPRPNEKERECGRPGLPACPR